MLSLESFKKRCLACFGFWPFGIDSWVIRLKVFTYSLLSPLPFQDLTLANTGLELTAISLPQPPEYWDSRAAPPLLMLLHVVECQHSWWAWHVFPPPLWLMHYTTKLPFVLWVHTNGRLSFGQQLPFPFVWPGVVPGIRELFHIPGQFPGQVLFLYKPWEGSVIRVLVDSFHQYSPTWSTFFIQFLAGAFARAFNLRTHMVNNW